MSKQPPEKVPTKGGKLCCSYVAGTITKSTLMRVLSPQENAVWRVICHIFILLFVLLSIRFIFTGVSSLKTLGPAFCLLRDVRWSPKFQAALIIIAMLLSARITSFLKASNTLRVWGFLSSHWSGFYSHLLTVARFHSMAMQNMITVTRVRDHEKNWQCVTES